jgi:hypothetical protein
MGKSQRMLESLKGTNGGERDEHLSVFIGLNQGGRRESAVGEVREKYKYPSYTNG